MNENNNFGKYFFKLSSQDQEYLLLHENGNKCWQTDYRLLRQRDNEHNDFMAEEEHYLTHLNYKHRESAVSN